MDEDLEGVWELWSRCRTQMRFSFAGVAGLDYNAVKVVADATGAELDGWTLDMLRILENDLLKEQEERRERDEKEAQCRH
jgi:hypothetical protein